MFYEKTLDSSLRFGDVILKQDIAYLKLNDMTQYGDSSSNICLSKPEFSVVVTPCCSIGENKIALSPLLIIRSNIYNNDYFYEDITRVNSPVPVENKMSKKIFDKLTDLERADILMKGSKFELVDFFIYKELDLFEDYKITKFWETGVPTMKIRDRMIDFRIISHIIPVDLKENNGNSTFKKVAQLSIDSRSKLRDKISNYYSRIPPEDEE